MYYLIQSNIYSDPEHHKAFEAIEELGLEYEAFELPPSAETLTPNTNRKDIFVYGSVKLARLAKAHTDWNPGSFYGGNHTFEIYSKHYREHLLNDDAHVFRFSETQTWPAGETRFIKPYQDAKVFTGRIFTETEWNGFVQDSLAHPKTDRLHADTRVQASLPKKIIKEARLWIVGERVIAGVYYHRHDHAPLEKEVSRDGIEFAETMLAIFNVADAFVMDICLTDKGWKIVEVNCINSAGFYGLNVKTLFRALEAFFEPS